jgi:elongation factor 1-gamma
LKSNIRLINSALQGKEYLVGNKITVADLVIVVALILPFQVTLDPGFRKSVENVSKYFERVTALPQFVKRFGKIRACQKSIKPVLAAKEEKKAAPVAKAAAKKEEGEESAAEKKLSNPLDELPPTTFDLYSFKTFFVNNPDRRGDGMKFFFENYDKQGYSIYFLHYNKYEGEGIVLYQTANLLNGFLQRIDHFRKHAFAMHCLLGEEPNLEIEGVWLFRGKGIPQEMIDHP